MYKSVAIPPPKIVDRPFKKPLLCGPGPSNVWPSVFDALTGPMISAMEDEYYDVINDIRKGLQYTFQTKSRLVLALSGAGHSGMETVISNLVAPGETMVIAARGIWDERAHSMAQRYGINVVVQRRPLTETFTLEELETVLKRVRPKALFIVHGDSSTGTVQNLIGLGDLCHKYGALLLVDTVVTLVALPFLMDEWGVDAVYTSTQKAFSGPAGISGVAFSARAEHVINNRKHQPPFYFDIKELAQQWNCYGETRAYHHTLSPPLMYALRCCLQEIGRETLPVTWARHLACTQHFHKRLRRMPVKFFVPKPEDRLATVTTVVLPDSYSYSDVVKYIYQKHNIVIFGGIGPTVGKTLRIGLMGVNATIAVADAVADALEDALLVLKKSKL